MPDVETVDRWLREAEPVFADFRLHRETWDRLIHRELPAKFPPEFGANRADYQTAELQRALGDITDILTMNPTKWDAYPEATGPDAERAARELALWAARNWGEQDDGRWWDIAVGEAQARYGVAVMRMLYAPLGSEEEMDGTPFYWRDVQPLACYWLERGRRAEVVIWQYDLPILRAGEEYKRPKQKLSVDTGGRLIWIGDDVVVDKSLWNRNVRVLLCEYLDKDKHCPICPDGHALWAGIEIVRGAEAGGDAEVVDRYTLPYKHAPSLRIIPGRRTGQRNPDRRFIPLLYTMYIEANWINYLESLLATANRRDLGTENRVIGMSRVPAETLAQLSEDARAEEPYKVPSTGVNEIPRIMGEPTSWPNADYTTLLALLSEARRRFEAAKPARFLLGRNYEEAAQGTGTANVQALQQERLPFSRLLVESDTAILQGLEDQIHAIRYWDSIHGENGGGMMYKVVAKGDEPMRRGGGSPGKALSLSASALARPARLFLATEAETLMEQAERRRQAVEGLRQGAITTDQFLHDWGFADVEHQNRELEKERTRRLVRPKKDAAKMLIVDKLFSALADLPPAPAVALPEPMPGGNGQGAAPATPQPTVRLPALNRPEGGPMPGPER